MDARRVNLSTQSLTANVARLKEYQSRLILFPRKSGAHKKGDASKEEIAGAKGKTTQSTNSVLPIINDAEQNAIREIKKSEMPKGEENAYRKLRMARSDARLVGVREKRAKAKADEAQTKK